MSVKTVDNKTFDKLKTLKQLECPLNLLPYFNKIDFTTYIVPDKK